MIVELFAIGGIIAACAALTWHAKIRYQHSIERRLDEIEAKNADMARAGSTANVQNK